MPPPIWSSSLATVLASVFIPSAPLKLCAYISATGQLMFVLSSLCIVLYVIVYCESLLM